MDHWLKTGSVNKRKTKESTDHIHIRDLLSSITNIATENLKKLPQVSDTKLLLSKRL